MSELSEREQQAFAYLESEFLWPFDAGWVRHSVRNALRRARADEDGLDRLLAALVAHWRKEARSSLPADVVLAVDPSRETYRDAAGDRWLTLEVRPRWRVADAVVWGLSLILLLPALIGVALPPDDLSSGSSGDEGLGYLASVCCLGPPLLLLTLNSFWRMFRPPKGPHSLVREGTRLTLDGDPVGHTDGVEVDLDFGHLDEVVIRDGEGRVRPFYRSDDRRSARIVAIVLESLVRSR
ncbi:MAG: hypothetical protein JJ863_06055 [Deltaproteobacteria bacterium]|nr:hypothetical protein [Deltaproteobacteria bacterium]